MLVVDDDPAILATVADVLDFGGYVVVAAADGTEALGHLEAGLEPCAILLDMRMPRMNGWAFAAALRERGLSLRNVAVMTAASDARAWAEEIGAGACLSKPFGIDELLDTAERLCA